jgi:GT2 family glycosyltransferase
VAVRPHPEVTVVVATHDRPLRLRWLLNALEEQTLPRDRFEVVVADDSGDPRTTELVRSHPLAKDETLRQAELPEGAQGVGASRNAGWRLARAPLVAFTDDDCRPPPEWLERALDAARRRPGAVVQGATVPDPDELHMERAAPHAHTQRVYPPTPWAQGCNIVYPRELLDRLGGFYEDPAWGGEDTDLALRARRAGAPYEAAPEVVTYHAVEPQSLAGRLRRISRWQSLAHTVKANPELRDDLPMWIFWKRTHVWLGPAIVGAVMARRGPAWAALTLPWLVHTLPQQYGTGPRGRLRALSELPSRTAIDLLEVAAMVRGSVRFRTFLL